MWSPPSHLLNWYRSISGVYIRRGFKLTTHLYRVWRLRNRRAIRLRPHTPYWRGLKQPYMLLLCYRDVYVGRLRKTTINLNKNCRGRHRNLNQDLPYTKHERCPLCYCWVLHRREIRSVMRSLVKVGRTRVTATIRTDNTHQSTGLSHTHTQTQ